MQTDARSGTRDRLSSTLFFAIVIHGVLILGITFGDIDLRGTPEVSMLRVTVVVPSDDDLVRDTDIIAQADSGGSGTGARASEPAAPSAQAQQSSTETPDRGADLRTTLPGQPQAQPDVLVTRNPAQRTAMALLDPTDALAERPQLAQDAQDPSRPLTRLISDDDRLEVDAPVRELLIGPDTRADEAAPYLAAWRNRVERIGTQNYPEQARAAGLAGNPVLEVAIRADGTLADIIVKRSSGHSFLDQAALNILRLAAPFEPFDEALKLRYEQLRFAYEWRFTDSD